MIKFIEWLRIQFESWIEFRRSQRIKLNTCESCESLKLENARLHDLIKRFTEPVIMRPDDKPVEISKPKVIPWSVRKRELEKESFRQAEELRRARVSEINKTTEPVTITANKNTDVKEVSELEQQIING